MAANATLFVIEDNAIQVPIQRLRDASPDTLRLLAVEAPQRKTSAFSTCFDMYGAQERLLFRYGAIQGLRIGVGNAARYLA
jgi:hypothetical protein